MRSFKSSLWLVAVVIAGVVAVSARSALSWTPTTPQATVSVFGGSQSELSKAVAVDAAGNIHAVGRFQGTADFDPGSGTTNLTSAGSTDAYVSKMDSSGNLVWAKKFGGTGSDDAYSVAVDATGNVFVTGYFMSTADFDPGAGTANLSAVSGLDVFVLKLDSSGNYLWAKGFGGTGGNGNEFGFSVALDSSANVHVSGSFTGTIDFDPGAGTANLTESLNGDAFILKLDASGNYVWARKFGGNQSDSATSVVLDGSGNLLVVGSFAETVDFDPGVGTANLTALSRDPFVVKLDSSGGYVWAKRFGGSNTEVASSLAVDGSDNVHVAGYFWATADFDPGSGTANLTSAGSSDGYVMKLDSSGSYMWAKRFGSTSSDDVASIALDGSGHVHVVGSFQNTVDFDPGAGTANLTSAQFKDAYALKLDSSGAYVWAQKFGGAGGDDDFGTGVAVDGTSNVYLHGTFWGTADFDTAAGTVNLTSGGGSDVFVVKMDSDGTTVPTTTTTTTTTIPTPDPVTNLAVEHESGQPRTVTVSFDAPADAETMTLSGYLIQYRCLTKATKSAPCTGKWRRGSSLELDDDSTTNGQAVTHTFELPAGIAGTSGRPVSFRVLPVSDDDDMTLGASSNIGTVNIRDLPILGTAPVSTKAGTNRRVTVTLSATPVSQTRGSTISAYVVEYSRSNRSWFSITAPTGGWGPGKSKVVTVPTAGEKYYFRVKLQTNSGTVTQRPPKSELTR